MAHISKVKVKVAGLERYSSGGRAAFRRNLPAFLDFYLREDREGVDSNLRPFVG